MKKAHLLLRAFSLLIFLYISSFRLFSLTFLSLYYSALVCISLSLFILVYYSSILITLGQDYLWAYQYVLLILDFHSVSVCNFNFTFQYLYLIRYSFFFLFYLYLRTNGYLPCIVNLPCAFAYRLRYLFPRQIVVPSAYSIYLYFLLSLAFQTFPQ